eukprot:6195237-Pleurochrysis_carterae.AAC.1
MRAFAFSFAPAASPSSHRAKLERIDNTCIPRQPVELIMFTGVHTSSRTISWSISCKARMHELKEHSSQSLEAVVKAVGRDRASVGESRGLSLVIRDAQVVGPRAHDVGVGGAHRGWRARVGRLDGHVLLQLGLERGVHRPSAAAAAARRCGGDCGDG